jgi:hypothetical protein
MRHGLLLAALLSSTLFAATTTGVAFADPTPETISQARDLGTQAQAAFEAGNFAESEKLWIAARDLFNAPTLTLGLARTQVKLGKLVAASESYNRMIREHGDNPNLSPTFKEALENAKTEVAQVSGRIASVVISVEGAPNPQVTIDGQNVPASSLGMKRPVDPGQHVVKAEAPGFTPAETSFQVAEAGSAQATVKLEKAATTGTQTPGSDNGTGAQGGTKGGDKTLAFVAFGVGGAGLVFGAVTGFLALGKHGDLKDKCPDGKCPGDVKDDVDSYKMMGTLSTVGFIVAGVGAAAGAVLWLTSGSESTSTSTAPASAKNTRVTWHPYVGVGGGGIAGRF